MQLGAACSWAALGITEDGHTEHRAWQEAGAQRQQNYHRDPYLHPGQSGAAVSLQTTKEAQRNCMGFPDGESQEGSQVCFHYLYTDLVGPFSPVYSEFLDTHSAANDMG